ncbi:MAG: UDP-N-acetylmuramoyl-L-alanine--D-glutamate ligase [Proteobacteria bacterium]|nr:UDP-N-acetylmuramoyl-L-alanine--D-glutamate ligase [Pseudomonadota bacterium]
MSPDRLATTPDQTRAGGPDVAGRRVLVVGLARTGLAAAEFLQGRGARVTVTDMRSAEDLGQAVSTLAERGVRLELGGHREASFTEADLIVVSPGVPLNIAPMQRARDQGVPITGEMELASRYLTIPMIAVTGTNGKTTTTSLIGDILRASGRRVFVGGNIGNPLIGVLDGRETPDAVVVEVSSFQLDTAETLRPDVGVILNVTPDHLDRYPDFEAYVASKLRLLARQGPRDKAVFNVDDPVLEAVRCPAAPLGFSRLKRVETGAFLEGGRIVLSEEGRMLGDLALADLALTGAHNHENVMAALLAARAAGVDLETACRAATAFKGLPHRVELVGEFNGVRWYDDSKGTNVGAVMKSLEGFDGPVILIAGGLDKAGDFRALAPLVQSKVKRLVLIGQAREKIAAALAGQTETVLADDMREAVVRSREGARPGDVVLLSPACASFDMFKDYAERGRVFAALVREVAP